MKNDKGVQVRLSTLIHKRLKVFAARQELTISEAVGLLIKEYPY